jgi:DNA polymerase III subunit epsilon
MARNPLGRWGVDRTVAALPWREAELWVVDLETTGLDLRRDRIIAYGAVPIRGGRIQTADAVYGMVSTSDPVPEASSRVHSIRTQDLADAPPIGDAVNRLDALIGAAPIVAHCAMIERALLRRAYRSCGRRLRNPFVDTAPLATATLGEQLDGAVISLEYAADALGLPVHSPHHALGDAVTTAQVLLAVASRLERRMAPEPLTVAALIDRSTSASRSRWLAPAGYP